MNGNETTSKIMLPCFIGIKRIIFYKKTSIVIRLLLPQIQRFITSIALKPIPKPASRKNSKIENPDFITNFIDNPQTIIYITPSEPLKKGLPKLCCKPTAEEW